MRGALLLAAPLLVLALGLPGCGSSGSPIPGPASGDAGRGRLLYDTACGACHGTQPHWREKRVVKTWPQLLAEVARWQAVAGQNWSAAEIEDTAAYLDQRFYRLR